MYLSQAHSNDDLVECVPSDSDARKHNLVFYIDWKYELKYTKFIHPKPTEI